MLCHYAGCHYAECHILFTIILIVIMMSVVIMSVIVLSVEVSSVHIGTLISTCFIQFQLKVQITTKTVLGHSTVVEQSTHDPKL
jgi:hypothetical protein